jgi:hypothetical protein
MGMKISKFNILVWCIIPEICFAIGGKISEQNQTIIQTDYPTKSTWLPTKEQTSRSLNAIFKFLEKPENVSAWQKIEIEKIKQNLSEYSVQFTGIELNGKKRIWCNFFHTGASRNWKEEVVLIKDGGFWYWTIEYDLETGNCINFRSNGYA